MTEDEIARVIADRSPIVVDGISFDVRDEVRLNSLIGLMEDGLAQTVTWWGKSWGISDLRTLRLKLMRAKGCVA